MTSCKQEVLKVVIAIKSLNSKDVFLNNKEQHPHNKNVLFNDKFFYLDKQYLEERSISLMKSFIPIKNLNSKDVFLDNRWLYLKEKPA